MAQHGENSAAMGLVYIKNTCPIDNLIMEMTAFCKTRGDILNKLQTYLARKQRQCYWHLIDPKKSVEDHAKAIYTGQYTAGDSVDAWGSEAEILTFRIKNTRNSIYVCLFQWRMPQENYELTSQGNRAQVMIITRIFTSLHEYMHVNKIYTYLNTYSHIYIRSYIRTYIHTHIDTYMFVIASDALAQASDFWIERRQVVFFCWMQDSNPEGLWNQTSSRLNARWQTTELSGPLLNARFNLRRSLEPNLQQTECPLTNLRTWLRNVNVCSY